MISGGSSRDLSFYTSFLAQDSDNKRDLECPSKQSLDSFNRPENQVEYCGFRTFFLQEKVDFYGREA
jgi:hypothetical protein